jgi:lipoyl(octanoyl) transferase
MNGIALNVDPRLEDFEVIVPCGIQGCEMTSMRRELGQCVSLDKAMQSLKSGIHAAFQSVS